MVCLSGPPNALITPYISLPQHLLHFSQLWMFVCSHPLLVIYSQLQVLLSSSKSLRKMEKKKKYSKLNVVFRILGSFNIFHPCSKNFCLFSQNNIRLLQNSTLYFKYSILGIILQSYVCLFFFYSWSMCMRGSSASHRHSRTQAEGQLYLQGSSQNIWLALYLCMEQF